MLLRQQPQAKQNSNLNRVCATWPKRMFLSLSFVYKYVLCFSWSFINFFLQVINLPLKRKQSQVYIENDVAQKIVPVEVKPGLSLSAVTGLLNVKDNVHNVEVITRAFVLKRHELPVFVLEFQKCRWWIYTENHKLRVG